MIRINIKYLLLLLQVIVWIAFTGCSKNEIKGTVTDGESRTPVTGAVVTLEGTSFVAVTDSNGWYFIEDSPDGNFSIKFTKEDYETQVVLVSLKGNILNKDVELFMDKPSEEQIAEFVRTKFKSTTTAGTFSSVTRKYSDVQIINKWADENLKGVYYIEVSFDYEDNWFKSSCIHIWRFVKQGKVWHPGDYPFRKDCKDRGGRGLFQ